MHTIAARARSGSKERVIVVLHFIVVNLVPLVVGEGKENFCVAPVAEFFSLL